MSIARAVRESIEKMPAGRIFGYRELPDMSEISDALDLLQKHLK